MGAFVWGDNGNAVASSTTSNQVTFQCSGGVRFLGWNGESATWTPGDATWNFASDRELKENFEGVDDTDVLDKVSRLPITKWTYKDHDIPHIGPTAQDFHAIFALGRNDRSIDGGDLHGVTLAAVQGLYRIVNEKSAKIAELEARLSRAEQLAKEQADRREGGRGAGKALAAPRGTKDKAVHNRKGMQEGRTMNRRTTICAPPGRYANCAGATSWMAP